MPALEVIAPGPHTTVQDLGRTGFQAIGVPTSGALDRVSLRLANALVGNAPGAPVLEMLVQGPTLRVLAHSVRVALVGCATEIEIRSQAARRVPAGRSARVERGDILRIGMLGNSVCACLAIEGGLDVPQVLGSASTYVRAGFGGLHGRRLRAGDAVPLRLAHVEARAERALAHDLDFGFEEPIRVVMGPQADYFGPQAIETFLSSTYTVSPQADRMGYRLEGPALVHSRGYDIVSDGIVTGSVQVPGSGRPIVLMVDNQTTGGYPKIATVISADVPLVARRKPGRTIRFAAVEVEEAESLRKAQEALLEAQIGSIVESV
jgi:biotin-dependent carboxylase-like uncharacterized protein